MYVVSGATGRVGSAVAAGLLDAGQRVRVIVRRPEAADAWRAKGAEVAMADLRDAEALTAALQGADSFFAMLPFDVTAPDAKAYAQEVVGSVSQAVQRAGVPRTVMLSSGGADRAEGTGPITELHDMEQALAATGTILTALRPGHFQETFTNVLEAARNEGIYPVFASSADLPMPMNATADIAAIAVQELLNGTERNETVDIVGPSYTEREVADALGKALGRELHVVIIPEPGRVAAFIEAGFPQGVAESLVEMYRAGEQGHLDPRGDRTAQAPTELKTTIDRVLASEGR